MFFFKFNFSLNCFRKRNEFVVVLIDMQETFVDDLQWEERHKIIKNQIQIIKLCRENNIPIVVLEYKNEGETIYEISEELKKVKHVKTIKKRFVGGFDKTNLHKILKRFGTNKLFVMGIHACACVKVTVNAAISKKYKIITSSDVIGGGLKPHITWYKERSIFLPISSLLPRYFSQTT